ncbi:hypothetical protein PAXRUDRAFT_139480 [Paxillus rubicundulus Ve08.2h10]|uniref:Uncharacterized protein n=1 Tax=Paxillus rubicundulus Ve08.2h10 TaxID=930991 RepID=A0A0D0DZK0_9AGAM|nr:hypothetical protein PAXRUDRAFT_139480 [Paxillus rubicundulus Ve08.2h10]
MSSAFEHPQSDGATEHENRTINSDATSQCVAPHPRDRATKLPAIESKFAINTQHVRKQLDTHPPFVLNYDRMPRCMVRNIEPECLGIRVFAQRMNGAIMRVHDTAFSARLKQTELANRKRKESVFIKGDLVYPSTANLTLPNARARKLAPKFVGPF